MGNNEMRYGSEIDLSEFLPAQDKDKSKYRLYGVTVHTGTASSGHYYCFLQPEKPELAGNSHGSLASTNASTLTPSRGSHSSFDRGWVKFDDESITRVSPHSAIQD